ncbi:MAG: hypothetical protein DPW09_28855 [Anaerolineae bacterium]|nr:hypothetical protein [Anaerolineae bacterium]
MWIGLMVISSWSCLGPAEPEPALLSTPEVSAELTPTSTGLPIPDTGKPSTAKLATEPVDTPTLLIELDPVSMGLQIPDLRGLPVDVGIFLATRDAPADPPWSEADAADNIRRLIQDANAILGQCNIHLALETAQIIALPDRLLQIQGNEAGSWGGHPPPDTEDPELFNYQQNERLTEETRELFSYGKQYTSPNTIAVFTVEHITYYAERQLTAAGGLSFPPNVFHYEDDYPLRNSVLLIGAYASAGSLPRIEGENALAHEIGHMLLNTGDHESDSSNLMSSFGTALTPEQCARMRYNRNWLFGEEAVPDPGPP